MLVLGHAAWFPPKKTSEDQTRGFHNLGFPRPFVLEAPVVFAPGGPFKVPKKKKTKKREVPVRKTGPILLGCPQIPR